MRPAARIQAAIEVLGAIEAGIVNLGMPADAVLAAYCRKRRYIGSKDRRAISALVYGVIRSRARQVWCLQAAKLDITARTLVISYLYGSDPDSLSLFGEEAEHTPGAFSTGEKEAIERILPHLKADDMPQHTKLELPEWMIESFSMRFGDSLVEAINALNGTAPFDLRFNPLWASENLRSDLKKILEDIEINKYSPIGFRSFKRNNIQDSDLYRSGFIEVQDEAAQLACYLVNAKPHMRVVDLCAGAGGKSLLISALMNNTGNIHAFDVSGKRLRELDKRANRSGCTNIETVTIPTSGAARDAAIEKISDTADRVLVDAPCSGTGTWRRNPDQRWRLSAKQIEEHAALQQCLLIEGGALVKQGGRLIYMTCSILEAENEHVVDKFLNQQKDQWKIVSYSELWPSVLPSEVPETLSSNPSYLQLAPHKHQTDGFFVAILEKL